MGLLAKNPFFIWNISTLLDLLPAQSLCLIWADLICTVPWWACCAALSSSMKPVWGFVSSHPQAFLPVSCLEGGPGSTDSSNLDVLWTTISQTEMCRESNASTPGGLTAYSIRPHSLHSGLATMFTYPWYQKILLTGWWWCFWLIQAS